MTSICCTFLRYTKCHPFMGHPIYHNMRRTDTYESASIADIVKSARTTFQRIEVQTAPFVDGSKR